MSLETNVQRTFIPGDQWGYYKLYCGQRSSDSILLEVIKPFVSKALENKWIDQWFFIRYTDPQFHIRLRYRVTDTKYYGVLIRELYLVLNPYVENNKIYKVQMDTYQRELERYGENTIEEAETIFFYESEMLLSVLEYVEDQEEYALFIIWIMDKFLDGFGFSFERKMTFTTYNYEAYLNEFSADKKTRRQLDIKYKKYRKVLWQFMSPKDVGEEMSLFLENQLLIKEERMTQAIKQLLKKDSEAVLAVSLDALVSSYIHMLINRAFRSRQRFYEMVCYGILVRYYKEMYYKKKT